MSKIVIAEFNEFKVVLNEDGWLNATDIAVKCKDILKQFAADWRVRHGIRNQPQISND